jgi:tRNA threonylcarbamoyladenosine biosynthesis protein TsaB
MGLILSIDTGTEQAGICLARDEHTLGILRNDDQKDHAAWLHPAIRQLMENTGFAFQELSAVACSAGPGSYTGLRVGMASAKGLCYALKIPLIMENTLRVMALAACQQAFEKPDYFICPMIDARRMEVFAAVFDRDLNEILPGAALILDPHSFDDELNQKPILFLGSGIMKWRQICLHPNAFYLEQQPFLASHLASIAHEKFSKKQFSDVHWAEPIYLKEFYTHKKK